MADDPAAPKPTEQPNGWTMGLKGAAAAIANLTAVALICVMFYQSQLDLRAAAREDRNAYRDELRTMHTDADRQWAAIAKSQAAIDDLTRLTREHQAATQALTNAVQALAVEVRELKTAKPPKGEPE